MRHRVPLRQSGWILFGALVIVLLVEGVALGMRSAKLHAGTSPPAPTEDLTTTTVRALPIVQPATTTTAPRLPVSAPGSLTYTLPANLRITVRAKQDCWVEAKTARNGRVLFEQILGPGQRKTWRSPVWIRFGNPTAVVVTAGSRRLQVPSDGPGDVIIQSS